jgi:hypothetical protein
MNSMFYEAIAFDQEINTSNNGTAWNTSMVGDMSNMFRTATAFNKDISNWSTNSITEHELHVP